MEALGENTPAATEEIKELANRPPFIRHEMDELIQRLASSGDQELITLGKNLERSNNAP